MEIKKGSIVKDNLGVTGLIISVDEKSIVVKYLLSSSTDKHVGALFKLIKIEELNTVISEGKLEIIYEAQL